MRYFILTFVLLSAFSAFADVSDGKKIFTLNCRYCHSIGNGKVVGPDLRNVEKKYSETDLIKWIRSSQTDIKDGDQVGKGLFEQFDQVIMPDQNLSDAEIKSVIAYIKFTSENPVLIVSPAPQQIPIIKQKMSYYSWTGLILILFLIIIIYVIAGVLKTVFRALIVEYSKNKNKS